MESDKVITRSPRQVLLPIIGCASVVVLMTVAGYVDLFSVKLLLGAAAAILAGSTIGTYAAGSISGALPGIFGAFFWGVCSPTLVLMVVGTFVFPLLAFTFRRQFLDAVFSRLPDDIFMICFAGFGIIAGGYVGGRFARPKTQSSKSLP